MKNENAIQNVQISAFGAQLFEEQERELLKNASTLKTSIIVHRAEVQNLADILLYYREDAFPTLSKNRGLVEEYLSLHDKAKLDPVYFWSLVRFFGIDFENLDEDEKTFAFELIEEINMRDQLSSQAFFVCNNLIDQDGNLNQVALDLLSLEKICDTVERGLSLLAENEFGRPMVPASKYLTNPKEMTLARWLENHENRHLAPSQTVYCQTLEVVEA
jgi:hypothetical protein